MKISKTFVQIYVAHDTKNSEGNYCWWENTEKTFEEAKNLKGWIDGVRLIEKTFDDETFEVTEKVLKQAWRRWRKIF